MSRELLHIKPSVDELRQLADSEEVVHALIFSASESKIWSGKIVLFNRGNEGPDPYFQIRNDNFEMIGCRTSQLIAWSLDKTSMTPTLISSKIKFLVINEVFRNASHAAEALDVVFEKHKEEALYFASLIFINIKKIELLHTFSSLEECFEILTKYTPVILQSYLELLPSEAPENPELARQLCALKRQFIEINARCRDEFQKRDASVFFIVNYVKMKYLFQIMGDAAFVWMHDQMAFTVLPLERLLESLAGNFPDEIITELHQYFLRNSLQITRNKETLSAWKNILIASFSLTFFQSTDETSALLKKHSALDVVGFSRALNHELLNFIYDHLQLSEEIRQKIDQESVFEHIPLDQFAGLIEARFAMQGNPHEMVLQALLNCYLTNSSINYFLHDPTQNSEIGRALADHNTRIAQQLTARGVSVMKALRYEKTYEFSYLPIGYEKDQERLYPATKIHALLEGVIEKIRITIDVLKEHEMYHREVVKLNEMIHKLTAKPSGKGDYIQRVDSKNYYNEPYFGILSFVQKELSKFERSSYPVLVQLARETKSFSDQFRSLKKIRDADSKRERTAEETSATVASKTTRPSHFRIVQWDKESIDTLFLGNEVDCCLAVGSMEFPAIVQRIMDDAMLFHVVVDLETKKPIALVWLYFGVDGNNDICLVGNYIEIKAKYGEKKETREVIINALLHFSGEMYCKDVGIPKFVINQLTYGWYKDQLQFTQSPFDLRDKLGGAFAPDLTEEERNVKGRKLTCERYYLQSLKRTEKGPANFHIYDPAKITPAQRARFESLETRVFKIAEKHIARLREENPNAHIRDLIRQSDTEIQDEIERTMGIFFDGQSEPVNNLLKEIYKIMLRETAPRAVTEASLFKIRNDTAPPNIGEEDIDKPSTRPIL